MVKTPQTETIILPAGRTIRVPREGKWMMVLSCTVASFEFGFDTDALTTGFPQISYPCPEGFQAVRFRDSLGAGCTIVAVFSETLPSDNRYAAAALGLIEAHLSALEDHDLGSVNPLTYGNEKDCDAGAPTLLLAANAARRGCSFQAKHDNSGSVYIGSDNTVTSTKWAFDVVASQGYTWLNYKGPLYGIGSVNGQHIGVSEW